MPPTAGGEWAVARFRVDDMYSNDTHTRANDPRQRYERFYFILNGELTPQSVIELGWVVAWRGKDAEPPTAPLGLEARRDGGKVVLRWTPSRDNLMVSHYEILRRAGPEWQPLTIATTSRLAADAAACPPGVYAVRAVDVAGNASAPSATITLTAAE